MLHTIDLLGMGYNYTDEEKLKWLKTVCPEFKTESWHKELVYDPTDLKYDPFFEEGKPSTETIDPSKIVGIQYWGAYNCPSLRGLWGDESIINWMELFLMLRRLDYVISTFKNMEQLTNHIHNNPGTKTVYKFGDHYFTTMAQHRLCLAKMIGLKEVEVSVHNYKLNKAKFVREYKTEKFFRFYLENKMKDEPYDVNGNMISDANKGITSVEYNHLDLPVQVNFGSNNIKYVYDADGVKLRKIISTGTTIEYADNHVYQNDELQFFYHEEGYAKPNTLGGFDYVYQYRDHVGNTRLSYTDADGNGSIDPANEIIEENNFYPFGLKHKGYNEVVSPLGNSFAKNFKYQNQEFNESFGYDMSEFELRHYDAAIGRFVTTDPYGQFDSPYLAMGNNPVVSFDPDGGKCYDANGNAVACPDDEMYDEYRDSDKQHITILDEVEVSVDNRPRMKPASTYDYTVGHQLLTSQKTQDDRDFIFNGYEVGMETPIHRFFAILDRDLNADEDSQEMVEVLTVASPLLRRTKHTPNRHVNKKKHPTKSKYKNPAQQKKLEERTIKSYDKKTIQGNGRVRYEKTYDRVIGTRGEKSHTVVVDPTKRKIITSFPRE